jgi:tetratricopeptide (TPR) repeat protein
MARILVRPALFAVITLSLLHLAGCSGFFGDQRGRADDLVAQANGAINEHNRLFEEARTTYTEVKEDIENEEDPPGEAERIIQARDTMQAARGRLLEAQEFLAEVRDLNVDPEIQEYAGTFSDALETQLGAEDQEVEFYRILQEDPSLEDERERALNLLEEVDDGYQRAEEAYGRAQELADANPELIKGS